MKSNSAPVPYQAALSYGSDHLVDPFAVEYLGSAYQSLQCQNAVLQQQIQTLRQCQENKYFQASERSYLQEVTKYDTEQVAIFPDGKAYIIKQNSTGVSHTVTKPLSNCTGFSAHYAVDSRDGTRFIETQYTLPNGTNSGFMVTLDKFKVNTVFQEFSKSGGTLCCGKDGPRFLFTLISQLLSEQAPHVIPMSGWNLSKEHVWFFYQSKGEKNMYDKPIFYSASLESSAQMMLSAIKGTAILKSRLPEEMQPTKLFSLISENNSIPTELSVDCKPTDFSRQIREQRDKLLLYVHGEAAGPQTDAGKYRLTGNIRLMLNETQKGVLCRTLYLILSHKVTPLLRENTLPVQAERISASPTGESIAITWNDMISLVKSNPDEFDDRIRRAYQNAYEALEDSRVQKDASLLSAVSEIICWVVSLRVPEWEKEIRSSFKESLSQYFFWWETLSDSTVPDTFRDTLYSAARKGAVHFQEIRNVNRSYNKETDILYDDGSFYVTSTLLKNLIREFMPQFLPADVLSILADARILSKSLVKTLTFSANSSRNYRFRKINRSFVKKPGCRDIINVEKEALL